jgi:hypothetical protein
MERMSFNNGQTQSRAKNRLLQLWFYGYDLGAPQAARIVNKKKKGAKA